MPRVPDLVYGELTAEQRKAYDEIAGTRGGKARGPFSVLLRMSPEIALALSRFGNLIRLTGKLDRRLVEIASLIAARRWHAPYPWVVHAKKAVEVGVSPEVVEAIRTGQKPEFERDDERLIYELGAELLETGTLSQKAYDRAFAAFGLNVLTEAILSFAFYTQAAFMANSFDVEVPGDEQPFGDV